MGLGGRLEYIVFHVYQHRSQLSGRGATTHDREGPTNIGLTSVWQRSDMGSEKDEAGGNARAHLQCAALIHKREHTNKEELAQHVSAFPPEDIIITHVSKSDPDSAWWLAR